MERGAGRKFTHEGDRLVKRNQVMRNVSREAPRCFLRHSMPTDHRGDRQNQPQIDPPLLEISWRSKVMVTTDSVPSPEGPEKAQTGGLCGISSLFYHKLVHTSNSMDQVYKWVTPHGELNQRT